MPKCVRNATEREREREREQTKRRKEGNICQNKTNKAVKCVKSVSKQTKSVTEQCSQEQAPEK